VRFLVENKCRYGALTSGTRTYFIYVAGSGETLSVHVSDAWFVGQEHYLRAWLYIYTQGCLDPGPMETPAAWKKTPHKQRTPKGGNNSVQDAGDDETDNSTEESKVSNKRARVGSAVQTTGMDDDSVNATSSVLKSVPFEDIEYLETIGYGRNGSAFKARWNDKLVAVKQFDVEKTGEEWFEKEVAAYATLKKEWGIKVPKPLFLSESFSGCVKLLGMQLGRDPEEGDDCSEWSNIVNSLEREYGLRFNDVWGRNGIFIRDEDGSERLVMIDLEDYDIIS
jgi:hypothetical protein